MRSRHRFTIIHSVPDYERWATVIRETRRPVPGVTAMSVYRSVDDPNEVMVELDLESAEAAGQIISSEDLRDLLDRAGVEIYPSAFVGQIVDELSSRPAGG